AGSGYYTIYPNGSTGGSVGAYCAMDPTGEFAGAGLTRLNSNVSSSTVAYGPGDVITTNNVPSTTCGTYGSAFTISGVKINYTNLAVHLTRTTTIVQCANIAGMGSVAGSNSYWSGSSWVPNSMCTWSDGIWANAGNADMTNLKLKWKIQGTKAPGGNIQFVSDCSMSSPTDTGQIQATAWMASASTNGIIKDGAYALAFDNQTLIGRIYNQTITAPLPKGMNYVAMAYDPAAGSNQLKLYINGTLAAQKNLTMAIPVSIGSLNIGSFTGTIDEVAIFNRSLNASEISQSYNYSKGGFGNYFTPSTLAYVSNFTGATTDFSAVPNPQNVTGLILDKPGRGRISFPASHGVNAYSQDYDSNVVMGTGFISVNSSGLDSSFN
ncbi:MAG TPA: hypothetical protein PLO51_05715, partial [Candidatus Micrarchaeota archaeon]|nr:hypothetical protein [Candidatus Micrarchaeota archaeon]